MRRVAVSVAAVVAALVGFASPSSGGTSDPYRAKQWGLDKIQAEAAWPVSTGAGALVAVVDTGVDLGHPDLAGQLVSYSDADFVEPGGTCSGKRGSRTCTQDGAQDKNGHGTHVAGIIAAATNNGAGVAGVAPGAKILPVRVLDAEGSGTTDQIAAGVRYAADKGADVINLSLGFTSGVDQVVKVLGDLDPVYAAFDYANAKGSVIVVAAGNDTFPVCAEPSGYTAALCVGSTDSRDLSSYFSNHDAPLKNTYVVAPGGDGLTCAGDILSTVWRAGGHTTCSPANGYDAYAGTSMAAPHVSGVAALLAAQGRTNTEILSVVPATADDLGVPGRDSVYGHGRVNAAKAVAG